MRNKWPMAKVITTYPDKKGLITKYNQISQNVDTTAHCPITLKEE